MAAHHWYREAGIPGRVPQLGVRRKVKRPFFTELAGQSFCQPAVAKVVFTGISALARKELSQAKD